MLLQVTINHQLLISLYWFQLKPHRFFLEESPITFQSFGCGCVQRSCSLAWADLLIRLMHQLGEELWSCSVRFSFFLASMLIRFNLWRVGAREQFSSLSKDCSMRTGYGKLSGQGYPAESVHVHMHPYVQAGARKVFWNIWRWVGVSG